MAATKRPVTKAKTISPAEKKRRAMNKRPTAPKKKSPLSKKRITEKEAIKLMEQQAKARKLKRQIKKHQKGNSRITGKNNRAA